MLQCMGLFALTCINTTHPFITYIDVLPLLPVCFGYTDYKFVIQEQVQYTFLKNSSAKNLQSALYTPVFRDVGVLGTN